MESTMGKNMDVAKFLTADESKTKVKWRCAEFLVTMLEEGVHADITLEAKGGSVKAHRSVLASMSPVFAAMFRHEMKEQLTSTVQISDMTIDALQVFLLLLYTTNGGMDAGIRQLNDAIDKNFKEFHESVMKYQVERRLEKVYLFALLRNLNHENCWVYHGELACKMAYATKICRNFILSNYAEFIKSDSFIRALHHLPAEMGILIRAAESKSIRRDCLESIEAYKAYFMNAQLEY